MWRSRCAVPAIAALSLICAVSAAPAQSAFRVQSTFIGDFYSTNFFPNPDPNGAVGNNHIVELLNGKYEVFNKNTLQPAAPFPGVAPGGISLNEFWTRAGVTPTGTAFDPRILYDPSAQRWYATAADNADQPNHFLVAVSKTADPTQGWSGFALDTNPSHTRFLDFPRLTFNKDVVSVLGYARPLDGTKDGLQTLLTIPKADLLQATPTVSRASFIYELPVYTTSGPALGSWGQPAVNYDNTNNPIPVLSDFLTYKGYLSWNTITGTPTAPVVSGPGIYPRATAYAAPVNALQPGSLSNPIEADKPRFSTAVQVNGNVWAVQNVNIAGRDALRWIEMNATTGAVMQEGVIKDTALSYYFPSIAVNKNNDVVIGFNGSSGTQPVSSYAVVGKTTGASTAFGTPQLLQQGYGTMDLNPSGAEKWGDYSATVVDPADPNLFYTFQQVARQGNNWGLAISKLNIKPAALPTSSLAVVSLNDARLLSFQNGAAVGVTADLSRGIKQPSSAIYDTSGRLYIADPSLAKVVTIDQNGNEQELLNYNDGLVSPIALTFGNSGKLYVADITAGKVIEYANNTTHVTYADTSDGLKKPWDLAFDKLGNLYVTDIGAQKVFKIDPAGNTTVFADTSDGLIAPEGIAIDGTGNIYVSDQFANKILKFTPSGVGTVFADSGDGLATPADIEIGADGKLYVANYLPNTILRFDKNGVGQVYADAADGLNGPYDIAFKVGATGYRLLNLTAWGDTSPVPEPSTLALAAVGFAMLPLCQRRSKRRRWR